MEQERKETKHKILPLQSQGPVLHIEIIEYIQLSNHDMSL